MMHDKNKFIIIDGSYYMHSFFHTYRDRYNIDGSHTGALYGFTRMLLSLPKKLNTRNIGVVFDGPKSSSQRKKLYPLYKNNRSSLDEELSEQFRTILGIISMLGVTYYSVSGYEGDDVIGTLARLHSNSEANSVVIMSRDKDMLQLISDNTSVMYSDQNITKNNFSDYYAIRPDQFRDFLALCGDKIDNIPGVRGIGPKTATHLLNKYQDIDGILENLNNLTTRTKDQIISCKSHLLLSRVLATIDCEVPLLRDSNDLQITWQAKNLHPTISLFSQLGFHSLIDLINNSGF